MMISDNLDWCNHGGYTKMTAPHSTVNVTIEYESKRSIVNEKLLKSCSTNKKKSKHIISSEALSQNCSMNMNK